MDKISQYEHLLTALRAERYVSGARLADQMSVSRTVINRRLHELRSMGLVIHAVTGKGYHLTNDVSLLNSALPNLPAHWHYHRHLVTRSTNDDVLALATIDPKPVVVATEYQTAGKGRRGRQWQSAFAQDLAVSVGFPIASFEAMRPFSLCVGVILAQLLRDMNPAFPAMLKWPNDLQIDGHKLAGILTELHTLQGQPFVIIGIGMNVNGLDLGSIDQPAISLRLATGNVIDRNDLLMTIVNALAAAVAEGFNLSWQDHWGELDALAGKSVSVQQGDAVFSGVAEGVGLDGSFLLRTAEGLRPFNGGQVHVRSQ